MRPLDKVAPLLPGAVLMSFLENSYFITNNRRSDLGHPVRNRHLEEGKTLASFCNRLGVPQDAFFEVSCSCSMGARSINRGIAQGLRNLATVPGLCLVRSVE